MTDIFAIQFYQPINLKENTTPLETKNPTAADDSTDATGHNISVNHFQTNANVPYRNSKLSKTCAVNCYRLFHLFPHYRIFVHRLRMYICTSTITTTLHVLRIDFVDTTNLYIQKQMIITYKSRSYTSLPTFGY